MYYLYYKYNDGTDSTWLTDVTDRPTAATTFTFNVNRAKLTRSGYDHIGWADKADAVTAKYTGGDPIVLTKDNPTKTIYAVWMPFFELKYDANGGTGAPASQTRTAAHPTVNRVTFTVPNQTPTKEGYTFKGWADSATATDAQYQPGGTVDVKHENSPKTVYAVWEGSDPIPVPSYDDLKSAIGQIQVKDVSTPSCGTENYDLIDNTQSEPFNWTKTARLDQPGKYDVTIKTAPYVAKYNSEKSKTHELNNANQTTLKLVISYENNTWKLDDGLRVIEVKHSEQTPPTDKPDKPTKNDVTGVVVDIVCVTTTGTHDTVQYPLGYPTDAQHTIGEVVSDGAGGYICPVTVRTAWFVQQASNLVWKVQHTPTAQTITFNLTYDKNSKTWVKPAANPRIEATHEVTPPRKPALNEGSPVCVQCEKTNSIHVQNGKDYARMYFGVSDSTRYTEVLKDGKNVWKDDNGVWTYQIKLKKDKYIEAFNTTPLINSEHTDLYPDQDAYVTWKRDGNQWKIVPVSPNQSGIGAVINVTCKLKAPTADELKKLDMAVQVKCVVDAAQQHTSAYGLLGEYDKDYFVGEPKKVGDDWLCDISYDPDPYVAAFNKAFPTPKHIQNDEKIVPVTLIWAGDSWQLKTQGRVHVTEVYTVTYTDGVENEEVFADQVYSDLRKDSTTPAFNGTPTRTGYTFAGWEPVVAETVTQTMIYVAQWTPVEPTHDDIFKALNGLVTVTCINRFWKDGNKGMDCGQMQYGAMAGIVGQDYTLEEGENAGTWVVTFPVTNFVNAFNKHSPAHNLYTKNTLSWYIRWEDNAWTSAPVEPGVDDLVKLTHAPTDWREVAKIATGGKSDCIHTHCKNSGLNVCDYGITVPFVNFKEDVVSVVPEEGVPGSYIATFKVDKFVDARAKVCNDKNFPDAPRTHKLLTQETVKWRLYATSEADEKIGNNVLNHVWEADPVTPGTDDVCEIAHNWVVTFDPDNGGDTFTQDVEYEGKAIKPTPDPEKTGYTFDGWYLDEAEAPFSFDTTITSDITLKAKWTQNTYTVTFDANGGEGTMDDQTFTYDEEKALTTNAFTRTGYTFTGWNTAADGTGEAFADKATVKNLTAEPNGAVTLYAQWEAKNDTPYKVKYYIEKLDGTYDYNDSYEGRGTTDTRIDATKVHNKSYENFTLDLNHPDTVQFGNIAGDGSLVLKLFYTRNTYDYTARHIKQLPDGSYDEANAEVETLSGKFEALAAVTAKDYGEHYPTNDADTKQNIKIEKGLTIDVKYDLDEHTLTFETNGGSAINPVTVRHGNAVARPADPTKDKYTFIGWYADPEFTEEYDFATVLEADKTIYAKFELTSTPIGDIYVRYDVLHIKQLPDGTYDLANAEVEHLRALKDTTVTAVIKDYRATHHVNVNRTLSKLTGTAIQPYMGVDGKPVYTILSVYYDLDFHTLTFDTMGGSKIAPETVRHGLTVAKPKDPVNGGYIFDGWYTDKTFRHRYDFSTPLTEDITIYAKWFLVVLPGVTVKKNTPKLNTADHFAYVQGYPDGTVKPAGNITRAETAAILFRLMDDASRKTYYSTKSGFRDVASGSWYNTYVATLNNAGVITDSSNGYFRPNEAITRAELAAMLAKFSETTSAANYFNDVSAKYWAANAIAICAKLGWITGYPDGTFRPDRNVTRAELMAMINRATGRAPKSADAFLPGMKTWIDNTSDKWYYLDVQEATNSHSYTVKGSETWTALTSDPNWSLYE